MTEKIISYDEIFEYARKVDKTKQIKVVLSKYQAFLFRQKIEMMKGASKKSAIENVLRS